MKPNLGAEMKRFPVRGGSTGGRSGRNRSIRVERFFVHVFTTVILLATTSIGAFAGGPNPPIPIDRTDPHGVRRPPAEASLDPGFMQPARQTAKASPTAPAWEFLGVWGGDVDIVAASPTDAGLVLAGVGPGNLMLGGLYRSTDGGATWQRAGYQSMGQVPVDAIVFAPDGTAYVGTAWDLWKSTDGGETWVQHALPSNEYWVRSVVIDPSAPSTVWVGVGPQVLVSTDGGQSWIDKTPPQASRTCYSIALDPTDPDRVFAAYSDVYASSSRLYFSDDGGSSWVDRSAGLPDNPIFDIAHDGDRVLVVGGIAFGNQPFGVFASSDAGLTWTPLHDSSWPVLFLSDVEIDPLNPNAILLATDDGVYRSDDGGASWDFGVGGTGAMTIRSVRLSPDGSGSVLAGEETRGVLLDLDGDAGFEASSTGINELDVNSTAANPLDSQELAIAFQGVNRGGIYTSRDGGATWLRESCPPTRYIRAVFSPSGVLHAISSGPTTVAPEGVYRRDPDGTWVHLGPDQGSLYDTDLISLRFSANDAQLVFAGGRDSGSAGYEAAIWRSSDAGASWTRAYESAELYRMVYDIEIVEDGTDTEMLASWVALDTLGGGALRSIDGGSTWDEPVQGLPSGAVPVALSPSPRGPEVFFLADYGLPGGLLITEDGGATWTLTGFAATRVWDVACHPTRADRVYVATDHKPFVLVSDDGGDHFSAFDDGLDSAGSPMEINLSRDTPPRLLLSTWDGSFFRILGNPPPRRPGGRITP